MKIESFKCSQCNLEFRTLEDMSGYWRLYHHQNFEHLANCTSCDLKFTSYSHATIHLFQTHDVKCVRCGEVCEGLCLEDIIKELDEAHYNEKEDMLQNIEKRIAEEEVKYIKHFEGVSKYHMERLKDIIHALDEGYTGCLANSFGMLAYLPFLEASNKHGKLSQFGRKLVEKYRFLSAMVKLNLYLRHIEQLHEGSLSTIIPTYMEDCVNLNIENENVALTPEMLIDRKLCFPERHIGGPDPSEWTNNTFVKKFGVPDRQITKNELSMESDFDDTFLSEDIDESDLDDTFLSEDIDDLLEYDLPELSDDEDATCDTTSFSSEIEGTFSTDEQKEITNQEEDANENDTNMSKKLFNHRSCLELLNMESDFDNSIINEDIDDLLDNEPPEPFNSEDVTLVTSNVGLETVNNFNCKDSGDEQKKANNQEVGIDESDDSIRRIPQSSNPARDQVYPELLLGMKSEFDNTIVDENINAPVDDEALEPSNDEDAALDTSNLTLGIASNFSNTDSVDEHKKAINQEKGADKNDEILRQITQSKNLFIHKSYPELSLSMESDFDDNVLNKDIDDLLDNESPEISNEEGAALDISNFGLELVSTFRCIDSVVDELINSPVMAELSELPNNERTALDTSNLDSEIVNTLRCVDSGVNELINSPVKDANLNALNNSNFFRD